MVWKQNPDPLAYDDMELRDANPFIQIFTLVGNTTLAAFTGLSEVRAVVHLHIFVPPFEAFFG
jgi:hypothetical protein